MNPSNTRGKGWSLVSSIIGELDTVLSFITDTSGVGGSLVDFYPVTKNIPAEWVEELENIFGKQTQVWSILEYAAMITGTLKEADFSKATIPIRELDFESALALQAKRTKDYQIFPDGDLPIIDRITDLGVRLHKKLLSEVGIEPVDEYYIKIRNEMDRSLLILRGGKYHDRFWHWLDRYYYETYRPWRMTRKPMIDRLEAQALAVLGEADNQSSIPNLDWLPSSNLILRQPRLYQAVAAGKLHVNFWLEPLGLADSVIILPGEVIASFAEPGEIFQNFYSFGSNLANKVQALSDPTRLLILRLIRNFGMNNTDMAEFLHIARPTVSIHVKILREAGLITTKQEGRIMRHEIIPEELHRLLHDLERFLDLPPVNEKHDIN